MPFFEGWILHQLVNVTGDERQQIVKIVSDASRQLSQRLHLLSLPQLRFYVFFPRDIAEAPHAAHDFIVATLRLRVALENTAVLEVQNLEVGGGRVCIQLPYPRQEIIGAL